jgi:hypothetical protein
LAANSRTNQNDSPKGDARVGRPRQPVPRHLVVPQRVGDKEPRGRAAISVHDPVLTGHIGDTPGQLAPVGGSTEALVTGDPLPAGGALGVVQSQVYLRAKRIQMEMNRLSSSSG